MSETESKTAAPLSAAEIAARIDRIAAGLGPKAYASASVTTLRGYGGMVHLAVYPDDILRSESAEHFKADTFEEALTKAEAWSAGRGAIIREAAIRRLALDIIDLTDQHGRCTEAMLLGRRHDRVAIADLREAACARAGEMAGCAPFSVEAA